MCIHPSSMALLLIQLLLLISCSSPPKPPSVNESQKRPANAAMAVDLQTCQGALHNTRIVANESSRLAEATALALERTAAHQQTMDAVRAVMTAASAAKPFAPANSIYTVRFGFNSTRVDIPGDAATALVESARSAPLVLLRGRTDGATDTSAASRIARQRAAAVRDYLVGVGVDAQRIRATYQPTGDHVADNANATTKGMNRRVEIEVYRALPVAMGAMNAVATASP
jgi:outer membrane protein OmpA-like peptidoglycan-associated protein